MLVTVGLSLAAVALFEGIWGTDPIYIAEARRGSSQTTEVLGARIPNTYWVLMIACARSCSPASCCSCRRPGTA